MKKLLFLTMCLCLVAAPAWATTNLNFGTVLQDTADSKGKTGGSQGISGEGGDSFEALVFNFTGAPVAANSVTVHLIGINETGTNPDTPLAFMEFWPIVSPSDSVINPVLYNQLTNYNAATGTADLLFSGLGVDDNTFGTLAIECANGHFGVGRIEYGGVVPIHASVLLLGSALLGLVGLGWRSKKQ